jgi:hypothetical protein
LAWAGREGKRFFFEKKNQKTFDCCTRLAGESATALTKVFCFFSSEKKTFLPPQTPPMDKPHHPE